MDPSVRRALDAAGRPPDEIERLAIVGARTLDGLEACSGLTRLDLRACDLRKLPEIEGLDTLCMVGCPLRSVDGPLPTRRLLLPFCDLVELPVLPDHLTGTLVGNPLSDRALSRGGGLLRPDPEELVTCRRLHEAGIAAGFATLYGWFGVLMKVGHDPAGTPFVHVSGLGEALDMPPASLRALIDAECSPTASDLVDLWERGSAEVARSWFASAPEPARRDYATFVERFADRVFYRETAGYQRLRGPTRPATSALRAGYRVLRSVDPGIWPKYLHLDVPGFDDLGPFQLGDDVYDSDHEVFLERTGLASVGWTLEGAFLGTRADDTRIFLYREEALWDPNPAIIPVFRDYPDLLAHVRRL